MSSLHLTIFIPRGQGFLPPYYLLISFIISSQLSSSALFMFSGSRASLSVSIFSIFLNYNSYKLPLFSELFVVLLRSESLLHVFYFSTSNISIGRKFRAIVRKYIIIARNSPSKVVGASLSCQKVVTPHHSLMTCHRLNPTEYIGLSYSRSKSCLHTLHCIKPFYIVYFSIIYHLSGVWESNKKVFPISGKHCFIGTDNPASSVAKFIPL